MTQRHIIKCLDTLRGMIDYYSYETASRLIARAQENRSHLQTRVVQLLRATENYFELCGTLRIIQALCWKLLKNPEINKHIINIKNHIREWSPIRSLAELRAEPKSKYIIIRDEWCFKGHPINPHKHLVDSNKHPLTNHSIVKTRPPQDF